MKTQLLTLLFLTSFIGLAQVPANYYDSADGLTGYTLKTELKNIISTGHVDQGYGALYTAYQTTDNDTYFENDNSVLDMYSENPAGVDSYNYAHDTNGGTDPGDACGGSGFSMEGDCYNREHLFPQGFFNSINPMRTDVHHVIPSDGYVNGLRSNFPFGEVTTATETSDNGSKLGSNTFPGYVGTVFEPIDEFKGDIARCLLYFATRYEDEAVNAPTDGSGTWDPHTATNNPMDGSTDQFYESWFINLLISWHNADPVSQKELDRNDASYNFQGNANPFINHPEYVEMIWTATPPDTEAPTVPSNIIVSNEASTSIDVSWTSSTDNVEVLNYDIYVDGVYNATTTSNSTTVVSLTPETTYSFSVLARDTSGNTSTLSTSVNGTTLINNIIIEENFENCATVSANFTAYDEASDKSWTCETSFGQNNSGAYQMNGFLEDVASRDWLITTNSFDFDASGTELLSFYLDYRFGSTILELVYSNNYSGTGDPTAATWINVPNITIPTDISNSVEKEVFFENIDISSISGTVHFAFKYYSNGSPTRWTVDSFKIIDASVLSTPDISEESFSIYPNPSNGTIFINAKNVTENIEVRLFDITGKLILITDISPTKENTMLVDLPKGMLLLELSTPQKSILRKVIIK
ncbi:endonuclease [Aquimarina sp. MMG016]|uniref:endonuclease n=1 Tax=Aquimarina sp. MMG016 TaxID=2822690 RepID=UPI001B3A3860|nr:endonuclease [Aquimarina sp. MMG016]MBQ4821812.1 endonuclease [Aquimarina sp. MMG016]